MSDSEVVRLQEQLALSRREIHNLRQQLSTLQHIQQKEISYIYQTLQNWRCQECKKRNEKETPSDSTSSTGPSKQYELKSIGVISTQFPEKRGTPRQPGICHDTVAKLTLNKDIFTNPSHALEGLQEFSHMWILFHFHKNDSNHVKAKVSPPRLNGLRTGVFATRSPHRPCPIGLSLVKIDRIMDNVIYFSGVDMVDQTPVFDIKPYIPQYDNPGHFNSLSAMTSTLSITNNVIESTSGPRNRLPNEEDNQQTLTSGLGNGEGENNEGPPSTREIVDGQENDRESQVLEVPGSSGSSNELSFHRRSSSRIGEREAPDGEEEEPAGSGFQTSAVRVPSTSSGHVRVPSWIDQAPVSQLNVTFKDRALLQLNELGSDADEKKKIITNVLQEDPRSVYLRERWGGHCYVFRIAELYVSCKFNDSNHSVTVYQLFQNERQTENDD